MIFSTLRKNVFFQDKTIITGLFLSLFFVLLSFLAAYFLIPPRIEPLALRSSLYFGIDLIGAWWTIFLFPLAGLLVLVINFTLASALLLKSRALSIFLTLGSVVFQIFLLIISILLILLNK